LCLPWIEADLSEQPTKYREGTLERIASLARYCLFAGATHDGGDKQGIARFSGELGLWIFQGCYRRLGAAPGRLCCQMDAAC
jgi:hypothetical protein